VPCFRATDHFSLAQRLGSATPSRNPLTAQFMHMTEVLLSNAPTGPPSLWFKRLPLKRRSAVQFPVFRNLVYELTAGQVGTGFAWKLYICCRVASGLHPGTPKGVKVFFFFCPTGKQQGSPGRLTVEGLGILPAGSKSIQHCRNLSQIPLCLQRRNTYILVYICLHSP